MSQSDIEFLKELYGEALERINSKSSNLSELDGWDLSFLQSDYRFLAQCEYILHHNIDLFKEYIKKSTLATIMMFEKYDAGEKIDASFVTMNEWIVMKDSFCCGDMTVTLKLANLIGGREKIEKKNHGNWGAFGYCARDFILKKDKKILKKRLDEFVKICCSEVKSLEAYRQIFEGLLLEDEKICNEGLQLMLKTYKRLTDKDFIADRMLFTGAIAFARLVKYYGMNVTVNHKKIMPQELIDL